MSRDDNLQREISDVISRIVGNGSSQIDIKVDNGEVILSGKVRDRQLVRMVEAEVLHVAGIQSLQNELTHDFHVRGYIPGKGDVDRENSSGGFTEESI